MPGDHGPEQLTDPGVLAEGPLWDPATERLLWVDILGHKVHAFDPATDTDRSWTIARPPAALALIEDRPGTYLLAAGRHLIITGLPPDTSAVIGELDRGERANDGVVDPAGRYLIGTLSDDPGAAVLYQLDHGRVRPLLTGVTISNGLDTTPDVRTLYYVDTPTERVDAFDYDPATGALTGRRTFVDLAEVPGRPDGLTVDAEGGVWVAMARGGAAVRRFTPDGRPDRVISIGVPNVTSLAFGGPELRDLYVTTSRHGLSEADLAGSPAAGALFRIRDVGVAGRPSVRYAP